MKVSSTNRLQTNMIKSESYADQGIKQSKFGQHFSSANKRDRQKKLDFLLIKIKEKGQRAAECQTIQSINEYKTYVKEYLKYVLRSAYGINTSYGDYLSTITIIDKELDELGRIVLEEEKETLKIIDKISKIQGLLIDVYQ
jgi:uncharacterized protein YaaR (DUF327 family)